MKIGIVTAEFNEKYTSQLEEGGVSALLERGFKKEDIIFRKVPGAFELPLVAKHLINEHKVSGVLCYGVVIRGETDHYDYVCAAAQQGCLQVSLETMKPAAFGVLTVNNHEQIVDRLGGKKGHKGKDVANGLVDTLEALDERR